MAPKIMRFVCHIDSSTLLWLICVWTTFENRLNRFSNSRSVTLFIPVSVFSAANHSSFSPSSFFYSNFSCTCTCVSAGGFFSRFLYSSPSFYSLIFQIIIQCNFRSLIAYQAIFIFRVHYCVFGRPNSSKYFQRSAKNQ